MIQPKKIALFYGHVASNIGDLAINSGTVNLLRSVLPGVSIDVVLIDADASEFLGAAKSSFDDQGDIRFTYLKTHGEKAPLFLRSPEAFFAEAGVTDADVVLLSAGEHFFAYQHEENAKSLFWRTFPAYAAKLAGKKCVQLPSTLGPFETDRSSALLSSLLGLTDALAVRDARSLQLLKTRYATEKPLLLDPAFFLHSPVAAQQAQKKHGATALVMRSEGWGIRLSNASRKEQTERFKASGYEASKAFAFSLEFASRLLNTTDEVLRVFVQTTADQELADELGRRLPEFLESGRLTIERPYSVQDYLSRLAVVDRVVSNRFHALILGMVVGRQTHGLYFDVHGHKIPGLFNLIESPGRCHNLSNTEPRTAATAVLDEVARETEAQQKSVQKRVEKLRQDTVAWLNDALQKPTSTADARQLLTASVSLGDFAEGQLKASVEGNAKKQIDLAKKSAQAKEAQWAQQRQQLEGELSQATAAHQAALEELKVATAEAQAKEAQWAQQRQQLEAELITATAEAQRLSAVNQAQLEALHLELPNTLSNKLGTALIEGVKSPTAVAKLPLQLYKLWRESKSQQPPAALGGESFGEVISAYASGGLDAVEKLLESYRLPSIVVANAYTALARHLKQTDAHQASESAQRAYMADPKPYRRKWLAFRLNEAGKVLDAEALLDSLPVGIDFSPSEIDRAAEIRRKGVQIRLGRLSTGEKSIKIPASKTKTDKLALSPGSSDQEILDICSRFGWRSLLDFAKQMYAPATRSSAAELLRIGGLLQRSGIAEAEIEFACAALERDRSVATLRECAWSFHRGRQPKDACELIVELERIIHGESDPQEQKRLQQLKKTSSYQLSLLSLIRQPKNVSSLDSVSGRICYVLHNSLPYATGGYASRSHGVATGLNRNGFNVIALTRPGFPVDVKDINDADVPLAEHIDGVEYRRVLMPRRKGIGTAQYMSECIDALVYQFEIIRPEIVWAASFYITALPALIAARRLGIPFIYEVRGLAEITKISREPDYVDTTDYLVQIQMEAATAMNADVVFTLTDAMRMEFERRGISRQKIHLIPNCCDVDRFHPRMRDGELARQLGISADTLVIGYIGTLVDYEGLDDLAAACAILRATGYEFRLLIVGSENTSRDGAGAGPISGAIRMIAQEGGFSEWLILPGRVPHDQVENYYSLIDIAPFPRKPLPVCEMVSPMKPLEALAMEKAVVVSSVSALREIVSHEQTGLVFEKGDVQSLAVVLSRLLDDAELRLALGKSGREWVERERTWVASTSAVQSYVRKISKTCSAARQQNDAANSALDYSGQKATVNLMSSSRGERFPPFSYVLSRFRHDFDGEEFGGVKHVSIGDFLFSYTDDQPLGVSKANTVLDNKAVSVALVCGVVVELDSGEIDNQKIADRLRCLSESGIEEDFFNFIDGLAGRHIVVATHPVSKRLIILSDATGMKKVVYHEDDFICSSNIHLINFICGKTLLRRELASVGHAVLWKYGCPGDLQPLERIRMLTPNHYLDLEVGEVVRFFPRSALPTVDTSAAIQLLERYCSTQLASFSKKYRFIFTLTAGLDSRTSLALSKNYLNGSAFMTYCTFGEHLVDLRVSQHISKKLSLKHYSIVSNSFHGEICSATSKLVALPESIPDDLKQYFSAWTRTTHGKRIVAGYRAVAGLEGGSECNPGGKYLLHVRSNLFEIARCFWGVKSGPCSNPSEILKKSRADWYKNGVARDLFSDYFDRMGFSEHGCFNYDLLDLFYWEHRMGTWASEILQESDAVFETHTLINSRRILSLLLSVPFDSRVRADVFRLVIEKNLPEIKDIPINPAKYPRIDRVDL